MNMFNKHGQAIYFWWTIVAVCGAAVLALYSFVVFSMAGDEGAVQLGFALCFVKLVLLIIGAITASSGKKPYLILTLVASALLPSFYFGRIIYSRSSPFGFGWNFDDFLIASLVTIDLIELVLASSRLFQVRTLR